MSRLGGDDGETPTVDSKERENPEDDLVSEHSRNDINREQTTLNWSSWGKRSGYRLTIHATGTNCGTLILRPVLHRRGVRRSCSFLDQAFGLKNPRL